MTKQLEELFDQFSVMSPESQIEKIREIRHRRSIERPASAKKRQKREAKKSGSNKDKLKKVLASMSDEERSLFLERLSGE